jgi:hypothetical protein
MASVRRMSFSCLQALYLVRKTNKLTMDDTFGTDTGETLSCKCNKEPMGF